MHHRYIHTYTCTEPCTHMPCCAVLCCAVLCCAVGLFLLFANDTHISFDKLDKHHCCLRGISPFICRDEASVTIALWFHFVAVFASILPLVFGYPRLPVLPALKDWLPLLTISAASFVNQICLNRGFQLELAAKASAMNYTQVCTRVLHLYLTARL